MLRLVLPKVRSSAPPSSCSPRRPGRFSLVGRRLPASIADRASMRCAFSGPGDPGLRGRRAIRHRHHGRDWIEERGRTWCRSPARVLEATSNPIRVCWRAEASPYRTLADLASTEAPCASRPSTRADPSIARRPGIDATLRSPTAPPRRRCLISLTASSRSPRPAGRCTRRACGSSRRSSSRTPSSSPTFGRRDPEKRHAMASS